MHTSSLFSELLPTPMPIARLVADVGPTLGRMPKPLPTPTTATAHLTGLPPRRSNPWQRHGTTLLAEAMTDPDLAIQKSSLNWEVRRVDMRTADTLDAVPDFSAIRRSDTGAILGVVGNGYETFQNQAMFNVIKDLAIVGRDGGMPFTIETAGSFQGGRIVWVLAHLPHLEIRIGDDEARVFMLLSNGHVGNRRLIIAPTTIRPICMNTLRMAEKQIRGNQKKSGLVGGVTIKHLPGMHLAVDEAREAFAATVRNHATTKATWEFLASKPLTAKLKTAFLASVFGRPGPDEADRAKSLRKSREDRIEAILASPTSQVKGTKDIGLSVLHAVVEYADHDRTTRTSDGDAEEARQVSATWGSGAEVKARAFDSILELTGA